MDNIEIGDLVKLREVWTPNTKLIGIVMDYRDPAEDDGSDCSLIGIRQYLIQWCNGEQWEEEAEDFEVIEKKEKNFAF
jgi:hypothetical protein|tara:strand:- start:472 stop:705 length:234 start_codon:yes stop_codon:yes gene_type:complete